jgi:hypothetical protein
MTRGRKILIGLMGIAAVIYGAFMYLNPTVTFNYRLTIESMTPDGPKTGSGVIQVSYTSQCCIPGFGRRLKTRVNGEAVLLDLGQGKILFVTLTSDGSGRNHSRGKVDGAVGLDYLAAEIFNFQFGWDGLSMMPAQIKAAKAAGPKDVPLRSLPTLVTFGDISNPGSAELVQPDRLVEKFGNGYALTKAKIEITDEPQTERIERMLIWLTDVGKHLSDPSSQFTGTYHVGRMQFIQGGTQES